MPVLQTKLKKHKNHRKLKNIPIYMLSTYSNTQFIHFFGGYDLQKYKNIIARIDNSGHFVKYYG